MPWLFQCDWESRFKKGFIKNGPNPVQSKSSLNPFIKIWHQLFCSLLWRSINYGGQVIVVAVVVVAVVAVVAVVVAVVAVFPAVIVGFLFKDVKNVAHPPLKNHSTDWKASWLSQSVVEQHSYSQISSRDPWSAWIWWVFLPRPHTHTIVYHF